jgi:hypothetical protein
VQKQDLSLWDTVWVTQLVGVLAGIAAFVSFGVAQPPPAQRPFGVLGADANVSAGDLRDLRAGRTIVKSLAAASPSAVGVFAAARIDVAPARFVARLQDTASLWKGEAVPETGTFSRPARVADVGSLTLPRKDTDALRDCRPGDCLVKLTAAEIERLRNIVARHASTWREELEAEFRQIVVDRVETYRKGGPAALAALSDHEPPVPPAAVATRLLSATKGLTEYAPGLGAYLDAYPHSPLPDGASEHVYWLYTTETPRPIVQVMHVVVHQRPAGEPVQALVASRQVLASHYVNGALAVTVLMRDPDDPSVQYLVYVNRSEVDGLGGVFSGIRRFFIERRIRGAARSAFERLKQRIVS